MPRLILILLVLLATTTTLATEITDYGPGGICFQDDLMSLYWFDPAVFLDMSRDHVERFLTYSGYWVAALPAEIDLLDDAVAANDALLESVMGPRQSTVANGGPRWLGFAADDAPDGHLLESTTPPFSTVTATGTQSGTASLTHGAWINTSHDPLVQGRLDHLGSPAEPFFHDQATGLYWCDPATFVGLGRDGVETWLSDNTGWRWATLDEVYWLLGKFCVGDAPVVDALGAPQQTVTGGIPRWLGYCGAGTDATDAVILQAGSGGIVRPMLTVSDLQHMASDEIAGAWVVTEDNPTPVEGRSLGEVKGLFR